MNFTKPFDLLLKKEIHFLLVAAPLLLTVAFNVSADTYPPPAIVEVQ